MPETPWANVITVGYDRNGNQADGDAYNRARPWLKEIDSPLILHSSFGLVYRAACESNNTQFHSEEVLMPGDQPKTKDWWEKADIIAKILSGLLLAAIALLIKTGADNISTSLKKGELVQSLISDLASEGDKNIRRDVALIALNHSLGDQEKGLIVEIAEQFVREGQYDKVAGSVAYRILEQRSPAKAKEIHDRALLVASSPGLRRELRSSANPAALTADPKPTPTSQADSGTQFIAKVLPSIVLVQFRHEQSRPLAEALQKELTDNGLIAPGVDRVDEGYTNSIRFFHEEDRLLAERVSEITRKFFGSKSVNLNPEIQNLSKSRHTGQPGQIEIWIDL